MAVFLLGTNKIKENESVTKYNFLEEVSVSWRDTEYHDFFMYCVSFLHRKYHNTSLGVSCLLVYRTERLQSKLYPNKGIKDEQTSHDRKPTCLWRPILSISDSTHPMLPSPPHTNILNKSKRWNNLNLQREMCVLKSVCTPATYPLNLLKLYGMKGFLPHMWSTVNEIKHLSRIENLFKSSQHFHTLQT